MISSQAPHLNPGRTPLPEKKLIAPPPRLLIHKRVACRSETCAILKRVSDWHGVPF